MREGESQKKGKCEAWTVGWYPYHFNKNAFSPLCVSEQGVVLPSIPFVGRRKITGTRSSCQIKGTLGGKIENQLVHTQWNTPKKVAMKTSISPFLVLLYTVFPHCFLCPFYFFCSSNKLVETSRLKFQMTSQEISGEVQRWKQLFICLFAYHSQGTVFHIQVQSIIFILAPVVVSSNSQYSFQGSRVKPGP